VPTGTTTLQSSTDPLAVRYDCAMLDLDGVVYRGEHAIDGVPDLLRRVRQAGMTLAFVTNNAARPPDAVAAHLVDLGVDAVASDVVTSAQAAAREIAARLPASAPVLVVGGAGLEVALRERGLRPVTAAADEPVGVVQGFDQDVGWRQLAEAAYVLADRGVLWVASNMDLTIPTASGIAPGNGALVGVVGSATGRSPDVVAGKPYRPLFDETMLRIGTLHPLVVGDRLDTDIEGANACAADSLLVMTGITDLAALCAARPPQRPSYVSWTLQGLVSPHGVPARQGDSWQLAGWSARVSGEEIVVDDAGADLDDGLRAVAVAAWHWIDHHPGDGTSEPGLDIAPAAAALRVP
jgi:glycerol 3-phosphatase-2